MSTPPHPQSGAGQPESGLPRTILERVRQRDPEALGLLFEHCFDRVYALAVRMLGDHGRAEDVVQEVFLRVHRSAPSLDPDRDPLPWVRTIAANLCRDHWRSRQTRADVRTRSLDEHPEVAATLRNGGPGPDRRLLTTEQEEQVQRAIEALPDQLREVVLLRDYEGLEHEQIADLVGATSAAVRKRYSRALARLGELLQDEEP